jgi:hypothetical protein
LENAEDASDRPAVPGMVGADQPGLQEFRVERRKGRGVKDDGQPAERPAWSNVTCTA